MKHAYLILAHGQWELLNVLLRCIDDERNDIFIHIDAKVSDVPILHTERSGLYVLNRRLDVRWGDLSVVEAEYALFEDALNRGPYGYYHLLSGVDLPIKSQDYIHSFFNEHQGKEFIGYTLTSVNPEIIRKVQRWHMFPRCFKSANFLLRAIRASFIRLQELLGIRRNRGIDFKKGSQWVSITDSMARCFLDNKLWVLRTFTHTFCSDEMVMQTLCWHSPMKENIWNLQSDAAGCMRAIGWRNGCLYDWTADDYDTLVNSDYLFARKFNSSDMQFIERVVGLSK